MPLYLTYFEDFSSVRELAESIYNPKARAARPGVPSAPDNNNLASLPKKPTRRPDPIILLSPSASSLLRLSNIKSFLESGTFVPTDASNTTTPNILHISRMLPSIDATRPLRFILVDTPEQFKPDYWNRVVAVFTTGQTWQFKSYKWEEPTDLFAQIMGIYIGWRGEEVPKVVRGWGRGVKSFAVDRPGVGDRWRDREVVEGVWGSIEAAMRGKGWGKM